MAQHMGELKHEMTQISQFSKAYYQTKGTHRVQVLILQTHLCDSLCGFVTNVLLHNCSLFFVHSP